MDRIKEREPYEHQFLSLLAKAIIQYKKDKETAKGDKPA